MPMTCSTTMLWLSDSASREFSCTIKSRGRGILEERGGAEERWDQKIQNIYFFKPAI